jgi:electron transfer flavoprotein beta subunit
MNIVVCLKQVPDTTELKIDPVKGTLIRKGVPSIINPDDKNALEQALLIKDQNENTKITVISMGPPQAKEALNEALAMGADEAILLSDRFFGGSDTWATSETLAAGIRKIADYDIIFTGRQAIDGDTAQVGPQIAERLNIPQVTYVQNFEIEDENTVIVERALEDGYEKIRVKTPVLLTAIKELNKPRYMSISGIWESFGDKDKVIVWGVDDLDVDRKNIGLKGSPTQVRKSFTPEQKGKGIMLEGTADEVAEKMLVELKRKHVL